MTVSTQYAPSLYPGNGVTTVFPTNWEFIQNSDLKVCITNDTTLVVTALVLNVDYTVTGAGDENGGSVTLTTAHATGTTLAIERTTSDLQNSALLPESGFTPAAVAGPLDQITLRQQEIDAKLNRALTVPIGETGLTFPDAVTRADKWTKFGPTGQLLTGVSAPTEAIVTTFGEALMGSASNVAARSVLGLEERFLMLQSIQANPLTTGTGSAYVVTTAWNFAETDIDGLWNLFKIRFHTTCTDDATITIDGLGPYTLASLDPSGDIVNIREGQITARTWAFGFINSTLNRFVIIGNVGFNQQDELNNVYKAVDESKTSDTSLAADNALVITTVHPGRWKFEAFLHWDTGAGLMKFRFPAPTDSTIRYDVNGLTVGYTGSLDYIDPTTGNDRFALVTGIIENTSLIEQTLALQWAQSVSDATATTLKAGSTLLMTPIKEKS